MRFSSRRLQHPNFDARHQYPSPSPGNCSMCGAARWAWSAATLSHFSTTVTTSSRAAGWPAMPASRSIAGPYSMQPASARTCGTSSLKRRQKIVPPARRRSESWQLRESWIRLLDKHIYDNNAALELIHDNGTHPHVVERVTRSAAVAVERACDVRPTVNCSAATSSKLPNSLAACS